MDNICKHCGLPKELCVCGDLAKSTQAIKIKTEKRKWGKIYTIITGFDLKTIGHKEFKTLAKTLKRKLACGGTYDTKKEAVIELQGHHVEKAKQVLIKQGFPAETIETENETRRTR